MRVTTSHHHPRLCPLTRPDQAPPPTHYNYSLLPLNLEEIMTGQEALASPPQCLNKGQQVKLHLNDKISRWLPPS